MNWFITQNLIETGKGNPKIKYAALNTVELKDKLIVSLAVFYVSYGASFKWMNVIYLLTISRFF